MYSLPSAKCTVCYKKNSSPIPYKNKILIMKGTFCIQLPDQLEKRDLTSWDKLYFNCMWIINQCFTYTMDWLDELCAWNTPIQGGQVVRHTSWHIQEQWPLCQKHAGHDGDILDGTATPKIYLNIDYRINHRIYDYKNETYEWPDHKSCLRISNRNIQTLSNILEGSENEDISRILFIIY